LCAPHRDQGQAFGGEDSSQAIPSTFTPMAPQPLGETASFVQPQAADAGVEAVPSSMMLPVRPAAFYPPIAPSSLLAATSSGIPPFFFSQSSSFLIFSPISALSLTFFTCFFYYLFSSQFSPTAPVTHYYPQASFSFLLSCASSSFIFLPHTSSRLPLL